MQGKPTRGCRAISFIDEGGGEGIVEDTSRHGASDMEESTLYETLYIK